MAPLSFQNLLATRGETCCLILLLFFWLDLTFVSTADETNSADTVVRFEFQRGTNALGRVDVQLFDRDKPETVRNFLLYVRSSAYTNTFLHRCLPGFVMQGGGFSVTNPLSSDRFSTYLSTTNYGRLTNEFLVGPRISNSAGTLAMAKVGSDPNSATSQWFFNLADNSTNLDNQNGGFTVFGRVLESTNANEGMSLLQHFNTLSTNAGIVSLGKLLSTNYQTFSDLPVSYTNTITRVPLYRELYYVLISILNSTNQAGQSAPTLAVLSPAPSSCFTNQTVTITGTAADDVEVARVTYRVQNGPLEIAQGTANWQVTLLPTAGFNTVTFESIDWEGNHSASVSVTFFYEATMLLDLETVGSGTVTGLSDGMLLRAGAFYTGTAKPARNYVFDGWTGSITSGAPTLTFQVPRDATNFSLSAKFIPDPLPALAGTYNGLFQSLGRPSLDGAGSMVMSLQSDGSFSGSILYRNVSYYYTGKFDSGGNATITGVLDGVTRSITLVLQKTNAAGLITGNFSGTSSTTPVQLERLAPGLPSSNGPPTGVYTFVIPAIAANPPSQLLPGGNGFGEATLAAAGTLNLSGVLGDGTTLTVSAKLTRLGRWPIYSTLAGGKGALLGWVSYLTNHPEKLEGNLQWIQSANSSAAMYPGGFSNQVSFQASAYVAPPSGTRVMDWVHGVARLAGTDLVSTITNVLKLSTNNTLEVLEPNQGMLQLSMDLGSGSVSGRFVHPWFGTTNQIKGTILEGYSYIRGQYAAGNQVGALYLDAAPFLVTQAVTSVTLPAMTAAMSEGGLLRFEADGEVVLTNTLLVQFDTALDANGHSVVIDGGGMTRLVEVPTNMAFSASGITFANGFHRGSAGADGAPPANGGDGLGGGILSTGGIVSLTNCVITNCMVLGGEGGVDTSTTNLTAAGGRGVGAAVCNRGGRITLQTCTLADNVARAGGGGWISTLGSLSQADAIAIGGALFSDRGECQVIDTTFVRNQVRGGPPLLLPSGEYSRAGDAAGGAVAITGGTLKFTGSRCLTNMAAAVSMTTSNAGSGDSYGGALFVETNVTAILEQSIFIGNMAAAGQFEQTAESAKSKGGAVYSAGSLELRNCTFEQNTAVGGLSRPAGQAFGGALASDGSCVINNSTFNDNVARGGEYRGAGTFAVPGAPAAGGGIYALTGALAITNSTFAFNHALGGSGTEVPGVTNGSRGDGWGGALATASNSAVLVNVTVAFNEAAPGALGDTNSGTGYGGGLANLNAGLRLRSSIVASNSPANFFGGITDAGYNLSSDASFAFTASGSLTNVDPLLGPLTTNGGPTRSMAIQAQSPARDAVRGDYPAVDQRGTSRPQGTYADSGAFEFVQTLPTVSLQPSGTNVVRAGTNFTFQAQATGPTPLGYLWLKDDAWVESATNAGLTLTNIQAGDAGRYSALATNSFGAVTSTVATLIVDLRPYILTQPSDVMVAPGGSTFLVVSATGPELSYFWFHEGISIPGAQNATLPIVGAEPGTQGAYQVLITNYAGAVTSRVAHVTFSAAALSILTQPKEMTVALGTSNSLTVLASGVLPITYQWMRDNAALPEATNNVLSFANTSRTNAGSYRVVVANHYMSLTSSPAVLTVVAPPFLAITSQPPNLSLFCYGDPGRTHRLLSATNLAPGALWSVLVTNTMPASGSISWTQPGPTNGESLYFRAVTP